MNNRLVLGSVLASLAAVAPVVIGRFGDTFAGFLRADALLGFGVVATLVALITLEYRLGARRIVRQPVVLRTISGDVQPTATKLVTVRTPGDTRAAA
jgi:hypothetical protein